MTNKLEGLTNEELISKFRTESKDIWFEYREELLRRLGASGVPKDLLIRCKKTGGTLIYERSAPNEITVYHESGCDIDGLARELASVTRSLAGCAGRDCWPCSHGNITPEKFLPAIRKHIAQPAALAWIRRCAEEIVIHADKCNGQIGIDSVEGLIRDHMNPPAPPEAAGGSK